MKGIGLIDPSLQFSDDAGVPLAGGSVTWYAAGTTTPQAVYADADLTTPQANPQTLDSAGRCLAYMGQFTYDYVLKDASGTQVRGPIRFSGSTWPGQVQSTTTTAPVANANGYLNRLAGTITPPSSGTSALLAGTRFDTLALSGLTGATITEAATVYIDGAPANPGNVTNAYALDVNTGTVRIGGNLVLVGGFSQAQMNTNDFRLTLTSGTPYTSGDVTAATTIYCTPSGIGNQIALYDSGGLPTIITSAEMSIAVPATSNTNYDVFVYNSGGVATLELGVWTNATTRATAVVVGSNGVWIKSGDATRRYVGTVRTAASSGTTEDSQAKRLVWNVSNQATRLLYRTEVAASWSYSIGTWRQANANAANQVEAVIGLLLDVVSLRVACPVTTNATATDNVAVAIGEDTTSAPSTGTQWGITDISNTYGYQTTTGAMDKYPASIGWHKWCWLEYADAGADTVTWRNSSTYGIAGLSGWVRG